MMEITEPDYDVLARWADVPLLLTKDRFAKHVQEIGRARARRTTTREQPTQPAYLSPTPASPQTKTSDQSLSPNVPVPESKKDELFTLRPAFMGCSIDLKVAVRLLKKWWQGRDK
jgi:hypothetical protein